MQIHIFLLNLFASIALISATMVIVVKNPIHSVAFLTLVFCNATGLLVILGIEFLALMFIIIYVGAIAVLFLFVIMMLNIKVNELRENWLRYIPIGGLLSIIFLVEIFLIIDSDFIPFLVFDGVFSGFSFAGSVGEILKPTLQSLYNEFFYYQGQKPWTALVAENTNIQSLGFLIYTYYFYYFLMAGLILLIAMIGAIVLTMHKRQNVLKKQLISKQVARNFENAISYTVGPLNGSNGRR